MRTLAFLAPAGVGGGGADCENHLSVSAEVHQSVGCDCLACIRRRFRCVRIHCCSFDRTLAASGHSRSCNTRADWVNIEWGVRIRWIETDYDFFVKCLGRSLVSFVPRRFASGRWTSLKQRVPTSPVETGEKEEVRSKEGERNERNVLLLQFLLTEALPVRVPVVERFPLIEDLLGRSSEQVLHCCLDRRALPGPNGTHLASPWSTVVVVEWWR